MNECKYNGLISRISYVCKYCRFGRRVYGLSLVRPQSSVCVGTFLMQRRRKLNFIGKAKTTPM